MDSGAGDAEVLRRSAHEPASFATLYDRHHVAVRRYVERRVGAGLGEELASEVFLRGFRGRASCRAEHGSALPWLLGVANHVLADHRHAEGRRLRALERLAAEEPPQLEPEDRALSAAVVAGLRQLSDEDHDALLLVVWGELSYREAATALSVPIGTIASRVARARRSLTATIGHPRAPGRSLQPQSDGVRDA